MAIAVNWVTGVITIPKAYTTLVQLTPVEIRNLDTNLLRYDLRDLEDDVDGRPWPKTHDHNEDVLVGGISLADVLLVLEPYTITFEDGLWAVNLIGTNNNILERTNKNQVSVNPGNSAGLVNSLAIEAGEFNDRVTIDYYNGTGHAKSGTLYPAGTLRQPVDNISDAVLIANYRGFTEIYIIGNLLLTTGDNISGFRIKGQDCILSTITVESAANVLETKFSNCLLQGILDGDNVVEGCRVGDVTYISGCFITCTMIGNLILSSGVYGNLFHCVSGVPGTAFTIDMGGAGQSLGVIGHNGDFEIKNMTNSSDIANINILSGKVTLADTVTLGQVNIGGVEIDNKAAPAVTVNMESILIPDSAYDGKVHIDILNGTTGNIRPFGTATKPVNNSADAIALAALYNFTEYHLKGMIIATQSFIQIGFVGKSSIQNDIIATAGQDFTNSNFEKVTLTGIMTGNNHQFIDCILSNVTGPHGMAISCGLFGTIKVLADNVFQARDVSLMDNPTIIDLDNSNAQVIFITKAGNIKFVNAGVGSLIQVVCDNVSIELDSSCVAGTAILMGVGTVVNNSTMTVIDTTIALENIPAAVLDEIA